MAKTGEVTQNWWLVDASDKSVGRLASKIAVILMGKDKPSYTPHVDTGDFVVIINAEKVSFSGKKWEQKTYTWYTGYPGQKSITAEKRMEKAPELILQEAVRRMLPKNKLGRVMLSKLKIFTGGDHTHQAHKNLEQLRNLQLQELSLSTKKLSKSTSSLRKIAGLFRKF